MSDTSSQYIIHRKKKGGVRAACSNSWLSFSCSNGDAGAVADTGEMAGGVREPTAKPAPKQP